eukprot:gene10546-16887_t
MRAPPLALPLALLAPLAAVAAADPEPWLTIPDTDPSLVGDPPPPYHFVSSTLGDHMVLQRGPQQAVVWGHADPNVTVATSEPAAHRSYISRLPNGATLSSTADGNGTWRQKLPAMPASKRGEAFTLHRSATLKDVVFGDVYICGGQSNMQYSLSGVTNASAEMQTGDKYW